MTARPSQGDLLKIQGYVHPMLVVSKNAYIRATGDFHVCPVRSDLPEEALHIRLHGKKGTEGVVICEQIKLIDASRRRYSITDHIGYAEIMNISDAIQGIFEYD